MVDVGQQRDDRHVEVHRDVIGSAIISGDGNKVSIYYGLAQSQQQPVQTQPAELGPNPYRGLAAFQVEDADVYFGREAQIERLWYRLRDLHEQATNPEPPIRLLPILGPSGSGKSSLARAGLLPELARRPLPAHKDTRVVVMKPGSTPLEALAVVLARIATGDSSPVAKAAEFGWVLRRSDNGTYSGLKQIANNLPGIDLSPLVILVDQFEETYSLCKNANERGAFIDNLIEAARASEARVSIVITLRSDFLAQTQQHLRLNQVVGSDQSVIVPAMIPDELRRAIAEPARRAGRSLDDATIDLLIEQTKGREGALPMLQFALTRIWEGLGQGKTASETLKAINGVGGALAQEAQRIYEQLDDQEKDIAQRVFVGLVELGEGTRDTRRRAKVASLVAAHDNPQQVQQVLNRFSSPGTRLITLSSADGQEIAEITHEALFDHWQQINQWLDGRRDLLRQQRRIETAAEEWSKQGKSGGYLLQGRQLDDATGFDKKHSQALTLSPLAAELIRKSQRKRWINRLMVASLAIIPLFAVEAYLREEGVNQNYRSLDSNSPAEKREAVQSLVKGCGRLRDWPQLLVPIGERFFGNCRTLANQQGISEANLIRASLSGANLSRASLMGTSLPEANLSDANLSDANLSDATLSDANLVRANLVRVNLSGALLMSTTLGGADLSDANFSRAYLGGADLSNANLSNVRNSAEDQLSKAYLCRTKLPEGINLNPDRDCKELGM